MLEFNSSVTSLVQKRAIVKKGFLRYLAIHFGVFERALLSFEYSKFVYTYSLFEDTVAKTLLKNGGKCGPYNRQCLLTKVIASGTSRLSSAPHEASWRKRICFPLPLCFLPDQNLVKKYDCFNLLGEQFDSNSHHKAIANS